MRLLPLLRPLSIEQNTSGKSLSDLLESGGIDAIVGTTLPDAIYHNPDIRRLFPNYREVEKDYYKRTRIFPIMHLIALRREVYEKHPFIASSLFDALCASKERARKRMRDLGTLPYMLPWMTSDLDEIDEDGYLVARSYLGKLGTAHPKRHVYDCIRQDMFILPSASLILREAFLSVGGFDERLCGYEDDDLFLLMRK